MSHLRRTLLTDHENHVLLLCIRDDLHIRDYAYVAQRAAEHLRHEVAYGTVKGWIRRCKSEGLLAPDELRRPRPSQSREDR